MMAYPATHRAPTSISWCATAGTVLGFVPNRHSHRVRDDSSTLPLDTEGGTTQAIVVGHGPSRRSIHPRCRGSAQAVIGMWPGWAATRSSHSRMAG
jgi:hypothetical protein